MIATCVLCGSSRLQPLQAVRRDELQALWRQRLKQDVTLAAIDRDLELVGCLECDLRFFPGAQEGTAAFYQRLSESTALYYESDKQEFRFAGRHIHDSMRVLEIGAGSGRFSEHIGAAEYVGIDKNPHAIAEAQKRGVRVLGEELESFTAASEERNFDAVCAFQVLEHVAHPRRFIAECCSLLAPGGVLILSVPAEDSYLALLPNSVTAYPPHHLTRWTDRALSNVPRVAPVELVALYHDQLPPRLADGYAQVLVSYLLDRLHIKKMPAPIDLSRAYRVQRRLLRPAVRFAAKVFSDVRFGPRGHSVTAIYRRMEDRAQ